MTTRKPKKFLCIAALALLLGQQGALALLSIDGTHNQLFVFGSIALGYDSNLFSDSSGRDDYTFTGSLGMEYNRRAGIIAVDATASVDILRFQDFGDQDAVNPSFKVVFEKTTGRMTGSLSISAFRSSRSDTAVNLRTTSWNYPVTLALKYPINDRYYVTSGTGYDAHHYIDNDQLENYREWSEDVNLFYIYTSKLDLSAGYRIRVGQTDLGRTVDHDVNVGATGGLLPKLSGTVRIGYQVRNDDAGNQSYHATSALVSLTWKATRKLDVGLGLSRDFNTAATGVTVDTAGANLTANYTFTRRFNGLLGIGLGHNRYVSEAPPQRADDYVTWNAGAKYTLNDHLTLNAAYMYFKNSSTLATADYDREVLTFDVSSRF